MSKYSKEYTPKNIRRLKNLYSEPDVMYFTVSDVVNCMPFTRQYLFILMEEFRDFLLLQSKRVGENKVNRKFSKESILILHLIVFLRSEIKFEIEGVRKYLEELQHKKILIQKAKQLWEKQEEFYSQFYS